MRVFLIAIFIGGMSLGMAGGGWWNKLQAEADQTPTNEMMPQIIGAEFAILLGLLTTVAAAGALFVGRSAQSQTPSGKPPTIPTRVQLIRAALDEGRSIGETAKLLKVSAAQVGEVWRMSELRRSL
jgi:hypothetical protein